MENDLDQLTLFSDAVLSPDVNPADTAEPLPSPAISTQERSKPPISDKLSKTLDSITSQLEPDIRRQESRFRSKVIAACRKYKVSSEELGRVLIQYRHLFKPTRKWTAVCQAIAEEMGCNARTLFRCIDAVEKPRSNPAELGRTGQQQTGSAQSQMERQQQRARRAFVQLMEANAVNKDDAESRRGFYRTFLAELEADVFRASADFSVEVQGRRRETSLRCQTPIGIIEEAA